MPLGKDAPLSRCCMRNIKFVFSRRSQQGGQIVCTNPFCAKITIDTFDLAEEMVYGLYTRGLN